MRYHILFVIRLSTRKVNIAGVVPEPNDYWTKHKLVGDNSREAPYASIYPRLTTRSNTFKIHFRSQALKKTRDTESDTWDPELDSVLAERRGSVIVERYLKPGDPDLPDYATDAGAPPLDQFYKFRVFNERRLGP